MVLAEFAMAYVLVLCGMQTRTIGVEYRQAARIEGQGEGNLASRKQPVGYRRWRPQAVCHRFRLAVAQRSARLCNLPFSQREQLGLSGHSGLAAWTTAPLRFADIRAF